MQLNAEDVVFFLIPDFLVYCWHAIRRHSLIADREWFTYRCSCGRVGWGYNYLHRTVRG